MNAIIQRKIKIKWIILFLLIVISYTFMVTSTIRGSITIKPTMFLKPSGGGSYAFYFNKEFHTESFHWVGFIILSWIYGWIILVIAIADELLQFFIPNRVMDVKDILRNVCASGMGFTLRYITRWLWRRR